MATSPPTNGHAGLRLAVDNYRWHLRCVYDAALRAERDLPPAARDKRTHASSRKSAVSG